MVNVELLDLAEARVLPERKTGLEPVIGALGTLRMSSGGLDLLRRAA
ncbi:MAG: hypothetical protein AABM32_14030 [Chloroflexota bacterium]